jgi:hypothetical protein
MSGDDIIVSKFGRSLLVEPSPKTRCAAVSDSPLWAMNVTTQARALGLSDAPSRIVTMVPEAELSMNLSGLSLWRCIAGGVHEPSRAGQ